MVKWALELWEVAKAPSVFSDGTQRTRDLHLLYGVKTKHMNKLQGYLNEKKYAKVFALIQKIKHTIKDYYHVKDYDHSSGADLDETPIGGFMIRCLDQYKNGKIV